MSWADFRRAHPHALVLSRDTGFDRDYGQNPYPGYDDVHNFPFLYHGVVDGRLAAMNRVLGVELDGHALAVTLDALRRERVLRVDVDGRDLVVFWKPGTASALSSDAIAGGDDVGATGVFEPMLGGKQLTFRAVGGVFEDDQTHSSWDLLGHAVAGPRRGAGLTAVMHVDTFWFAWAAYQPHTALVTG